MSAVATNHSVNRDKKGAFGVVCCGDAAASRPSFAFVRPPL